MVEAQSKMSNMDQAPEPTMDEILASIRRIISDEPTGKKASAADRQVAMDIARALTAGDDIQQAPNPTTNDLDDDILDLGEVATVSQNQDMQSGKEQGLGAQNRDLLKDFTPNQSNAIPLPNPAEYAARQQDMMRGPQIQDDPSQRFVQMPQQQGGMTRANDAPFGGVPIQQDMTRAAQDMGTVGVNPIPQEPRVQAMGMPQTVSIPASQMLSQSQNMGQQVPQNMQMPAGQPVFSNAMPMQNNQNSDAAPVYPAHRSAMPGQMGQYNQPVAETPDFASKIAQDMKVFQEPSLQTDISAQQDSFQAPELGIGEPQIAGSPFHETEGEVENIFGEASVSDGAEDFSKPKPFIRKTAQILPEAKNTEENLTSSQDVRKFDLQETTQFTDDLQEDFAQADQNFDSGLVSVSENFNADAVQGHNLANDFLAETGRAPQSSAQFEPEIQPESEPDQVFESDVKQMKEAVTAAVTEHVEQSFTQAMPLQGAMMSEAPSLETSQTSSQSMSGANPFEQGIKDMLKPMLKQWLDENMPRLVEGAMKDQMTKKD